MVCQPPADLTMNPLREQRGHMADNLFAGSASAIKPYSVEKTEQLHHHSGLIAHAEVPPRVQIAVFRALDDTGSATIGDLIDLLENEPDSVSSLLAMEQAGAIEITAPGFLDAHSIVRRAPYGREVNIAEVFDNAHLVHDVKTSSVPPASGDDDSRDPDGPYIQRLEFTDLKPLIQVGQGTRRAQFAREAGLNQPGVYILYRQGRCYVGRADDICRRIGVGRQMPEGRPQIIVGIADLNNRLTRDDTKVLERMLWTRLEADYGVQMINSVPHGGAVGPGRYHQLALFLSEACAALQAANLAFQWQDVRYVFAGPAAEADRVGPERVSDDYPDGDIYGLAFSGLTAAAVERLDGSWLVLRGSEVRADFVPSANSTVGFLRAQWLHSGILEPADDAEGVLVLTRDVIFPTCSAASQFLCGAKGRSRLNWTLLTEHKQSICLH